MSRTIISHRTTLVLGAFFLSLVGVVTASGAAGTGIHGHVLGQGEDGTLVGVVPDAEIELLRGDRVVERATTNQAGYYKIDLPPGPYTFRIRANGYQSDDAGRGLRLHRATGHVVRDFILVQGQDDPVAQPPAARSQTGLLAGRVIATNAKGEIGLIGARITVREESIAQAESVVSAPEQGERPGGHYEIALRPGIYQAGVRAKGFERLVDPQPIKITAGETLQRDFVMNRLEATGEFSQGIRGTVVLSPQTTETGYAKTPDVYVMKVPGNALVSKPLKIDKQGKFDQPLPPGQYRLLAKGRGYQTAMSKPSYVFPDRYTKIDLTLRPLPTTDKNVTFDIVVFDKQTMALLPDVTLRAQHTDRTDQASGSSDTRGRAVLGINVPGTCTIDAVCEAYEPWSDTRHWTVGTHPLMIAMEKSPEVPEAPAVAMAKLVVMVMEASSGKHLPNADLALRRADQSPAAAQRGQTDARGEHTFQDFPAGDYVVVARAKGYEIGGQKIRIESGPTRTIRIELERTTTPVANKLPVVVLHAGSNKPLSGVNVSVEELGIETSTDNNGSSIVPLTRPGTYTLIARSQGYESQKLGVKFDPAGTTLPVIFHLKELTPTATHFTFTFVDSKSRAPLAGVRVELQMQGRRTSQRDTTGADGEVELPSQGSGIYLLRAQLQGYQSLTRPMTLDPMKNRIELALDRQPAPMEYSVHVVVSESQKGTPVEGATVSITPTGPRAIGGRRGNTGVKGDILFPISGPGDYLVTASASGYQSSQRTVEVSPGTPLVTMNIRLNAAPTTDAEVNINGFVIYAAPAGRIGFAGIPDATLRWASSDGLSRSAMSTRMGQFGLKLPEGVYDVTIVPPSGSGYLTKTERGIKIRADALQKPLYFRLSREEIPSKPIVVTGYCRAADSKGRPTQQGIPDTYLSWKTEDGKQHDARSGPGGRYQIQLEPGTYAVTVTPPKGFRATTQNVVVRQGMPERTFYVRATDAPAAVQPSKLSVEVRLRHPDGKTTMPFGGALVEVLRNNRTVASGKTSRDGRCPAFDLTPGAYVIRASAKGYGGDTKKVTLLKQGLNTTLTLTPPSVD